jgi:methylated-DNA-[protein]-cysteine S-methyltransferase
MATTTNRSTEDTFYRIIESPIGPILLAGNDTTLSNLRFAQDGVAAAPDAGWHRNDSALAATVRQLDEYFRGKRRSFDLRLAPHGTDFQCAVWDALRQIPYGRTTTYGAIAERIGRPKAVRAVGAANGQNPLPIIVPCHRVIGKDGTLTGFGGGLPIKQALLQLEGAWSAQATLDLATPRPARPNPRRQQAGGNRERGSRRCD